MTTALPLLALRSGMVLPGARISLPVGRRRSRALAEAVRTNDEILLGIQKSPDVREPALSDLYGIGVRARVLQKTDRGRRGILLLVEGLDRVHLDALVGEEPYLRATSSAVVDEDESSDEAVALAASLRAQLLDRGEALGAGLRTLVEETQAPARLADRLAGVLDAPQAQRVEVLLERHVPTRLRLAVQMLAKARAAAELRETIDSEVRRSLGKHQKEAVLREQLKAIKKELGEAPGAEGDALREKLEKLDLPEDARTQVDRELRRLESLSAQSPDAAVTRRYLELIAELPWTESAPASEDLSAVEQLLEEEHHGLEDVKRRILEHMAVLKLNGRARGTILCLVGPPGVGKTSLAQSVASATGRPLQRIALGGVRDEAEIRGHRRTYVGALPGRILDALRKAGVNNPVVVLDEVDKLGRGWQGDPEAALLEVLDPEQNHAFTDHYLELPFDLSEVLFIATANDLSGVRGPLRDRLEVIEVSGYTTDEKEIIASRHLLPKQLEKHGLPDDALQLADGVIARIVRDYTREAGVRQLARELAKLCRAVALEWARRLPADTSSAAAIEPATVDLDGLEERLGRPRFFLEVAEASRPPGVAAGLAWTPTGGNVLYIESTRMEGKGAIEITGQLGDVMKESARAALAYLRTHADHLGVDPRFLESTDLHIHVPAGAVPKDGPSAGVTIFTALASLLTNRRVRPDTAMTGEASLRGRVLPVGGIKSKVLAARRAGFSRVLLPAQNERDLADLPDSVRDELEIVLVADMKTVLENALCAPADSPAPDVEPEAMEPASAH